MAEKSYLWTTGGAGDGSATYTRADWTVIARVLASVHGDNGVGPDLGNGLSATVPGANTVRVNTGGAVVDGKPYYNDSTVDVTIPSAVGTGNTRIDRVVLRCNWTAQTIRVTRIAGTDAGTPSAPALTQTPGTTYDVPLYQALVNTSGAVTLTDERQLGTVSSSDLANGAVTDAKIRNGAGTSVIGRSANTTGAVTDIAASGDNQVLRRVGGVLEFGTVPNAALVDHKELVYLKVLWHDETPTVGNGALFFTVPPYLVGNIVDLDIAVKTPSTSGTPTVQVANCGSNPAAAGTDILSTPATIDVNEYSSLTAAVQPVIANAALVAGDVLRVDVYVAGTGTQGLDVWFVVEKG